ncbi:hypothetical protein WAI453_010673 [Rhynchosporium graminicola]
MERCSSADSNLLDSTVFGTKTRNSSRPIDHQVRSDDTKKQITCLPLGSRTRHRFTYTTIRAVSRDVI